MFLADLLRFAAQYQGNRTKIILYLKLCFLASTASTRFQYAYYQ
jgi:hypothetical protein